MAKAKATKSKRPKKPEEVNGLLVGDGHPFSSISFIFVILPFYNHK